MRIRPRLHHVAIVLLALLAPLAGVRAADPPAPESVAERVRTPRVAEGVLIVHYLRPDGEYGGWNLWTWAEGAEGQGVLFSGRTEAGRFAVVPVGDEDRRGVIVRRGDWQDRDVGHDRWINLEDDGVTEVWLVSGDERIYTDPAEVDLSVRIVGAFLDDSDTILLSATGRLDREQRAGAAVLVDGAEGAYAVESFLRSDAYAAGRMIYEVDLDRDVAFEDVASLSLAMPDAGTVTVYARNVLTEDRFTALDAELGSRWSPDETIFRIWSPVSDSVDLLLYASPDAPEPQRIVSMEHAGRGVWEATVEGDLHGTAYQYRYDSYGQQRIAPDIHCFAATMDSDRSIVVDLSRTNPEGWSADGGPRIEHQTDEIIYEIHVRDFSIADPSLERNLRGTYLGLIHEGEVLGVSTGLAHLKDLGVTAVHLLPVHDYPGSPDQYNWGYWTTLFNVPESNYSSDHDDPMQAIIDLKTAIAGLHDAGIRVILDVVYNHTSSSFEHSPFDQSVPWYYFRTTVDGRLTNDAGEPLDDFGDPELPQGLRSELLA